MSALKRWFIQDEQKTFPESWVAEQKLLKDSVYQKGVKGGRHPEAHAEEKHCVQAPVDVPKHKNDA